MGPPHKVEDLGETQIPQEIFMEYLFDLQAQFTLASCVFHLGFLF